MEQLNNKTMKRFYWDIETEGLSVEQITPLMPEFEAGGNVKDPAKIAAAIEEKKKDWLDKAALKAITGKIVAITTAWDDNEPNMDIGDEAGLIQRLIDQLMNVIGNNAEAYAWNGHGFDLPFVCQRGAVNGVQAFKVLTTKWKGRRSWNESFTDPKLVWANYSPDHTGTSLKSVALALGVGEKTGNGKDFAALLKTNPSEAERYAKADITLMRDIIKRMGI